MSFSSTPRLTLSQLLGDPELNAEEPKKKYRLRVKELKELKELANADTAAAAVDEVGKDIKPHISNAASTLKHRRSLYERCKEFYKHRAEPSKATTNFPHPNAAFPLCGAIGSAHAGCYNAYCMQLIAHQNEYTRQAAKHQRIFDLNTIPGNDLNEIDFGYENFGANTPLRHFAWEVSEKCADGHLLVEPTKLVLQKF